ncbi:hypothetical protein DdX_21031 [Ditylenchus destructor]|uniref:Uncharacterized protein n=1 Tax=Ditylenchus destructor TaxID=166010 RepID=A0AAD4MG70_9BILA|nr:hypothetical protein DdX_21031 [Ditylenchus destructor]
MVLKNLLLCIAVCLLLDTEIVVSENNGSLGKAEEDGKDAAQHSLSVGKEETTVTLNDDNIGSWIEIEVGYYYKERKIVVKITVRTVDTFEQLGRYINDAFPANKVAKLTRSREQKAMHIVFNSENGDVVISNPRTKLSEMGVKQGAKFSVVPNNDVINRFLNANLPMSDNAQSEHKENTDNQSSTNTKTSYIHGLCTSHVFTEAEIKEYCVKLKVQLQDDIRDFFLQKRSYQRDILEALIYAVKLIFGVNLRTTDNADAKSLVEKRGNKLLLFYGHTRLRLTKSFRGKFTDDMHLMIFDTMPFWFWMDMTN